MPKVALELCSTDLRGTRFQNQAALLNVSAESLYAALIADAEKAPPNFDLQGRQVAMWKEYRATLLLLTQQLSLMSFPAIRLFTCGRPQECRWFCPRARRIPRFGGAHRFARSLNYSVSPIQYAFDDFTISQVAKLLGNQTDAEKVRVSMTDARSLIDL